MGSGRIKEYESISVHVTAIQFVRNSVGECYEFNDKRDMNVSLKNDKVTGNLIDDQGILQSLKGKDYIVKDEQNHITILNEAAFNAMYQLVDSTT